MKTVSILVISFFTLTRTMAQLETVNSGSYTWANYLVKAGEGRESRKILERASQEKRFLVEIEYEELNFSHTEIGQALIEAWKLPSFFNEITEYHHAPEKAMHYPIETAVIHLADVLVHALQYGSSGELFVPRLKNESWEKLNLSQYQLQKIIKTIDRDVKAVTHLFQTYSNI